MKKVIKQMSLIAALLFMKQFAFAQVNTGNVQLSVDLTASVISIDLGASPDVSFVYNSAADYTTAKTVAKTAHLTVVSNRNYTISVKANGVFSATTGILPLSLVTVSVDPTTLNGGTASPVSLSTSDAALLTGGTPSNSAVFNINYVISSPESLISLPREEYTTSLVYTATHI